MNINLYLDAKDIEYISNYCIDNFEDEVVETIRIAMMLAIIHLNYIVLKRLHMSFMLYSYNNNAIIIIFHFIFLCCYIAY